MASTNPGRLLSLGASLATLMAALSAASPAHAAGPRTRPDTNACSGHSPQLVYLGGPVVSNVDVYAVFWTANVDPNVTSNISNFYTDLVSSSYFDLLQEYRTDGVTPVDGQAGTKQGIGRGSYAGQITITPSVCATSAACTVTDAQVQAELASQVAAGHLPAPTAGCDGQTRTVYMIEFPANVTISISVGGTTSTSCQQFCEYHNQTTIGGKVVAYGVLPDLESGPCQSVCSPGGTATLPDVTAVHSHTIAEAVTDPQITIGSSGYQRPSGWGDEACGEIADICNFQEQQTSLNGTTWTVQQLWSNQQGNCVVSNPNLAPVCTGPNTPTGCRACECADDGYTGSPSSLGCSGATPVCQTSSSSSQVGDCVGAVLDAGMDSSVAGDAGGTKDAAPMTDSGTSVDGGSADSGSTGMPEASADATAADGAASVSGPGSGSSGGCGCRVDGEGAWPPGVMFAFGALSLLVARRGAGARAASRRRVI